MIRQIKSSNRSERQYVNEGSGSANNTVVKQYRDKKQYKSFNGDRNVALSSNSAAMQVNNFVGGQSHMLALSNLATFQSGNSAQNNNN